MAYINGRETVLYYASGTLFAFSDTCINEVDSAETTILGIAVLNLSKLG